MNGEELTIVPEAVSWEEAQKVLSEHGLGDGLPLVPPTQTRIDAMLAQVADPDRSVGQIPPLFGDLTYRSAAYQCVLAGCREDELPLVVHAIEACLEPAFNLLGLMTTTGTPAVATVVHGPLREKLGLNGSTNCLGPGNPANACIGRAISLVLRNIGGARENVGDMATMGQPGKYSFCFAEADIPDLPSYHVRKGHDASNSAVTVLGVTGTAEILPDRPGDTPEHALRPVARAMATTILLSGGEERQAKGEQVILLPPEVVRLLRRRDWELPQAQQFLLDEGRRLSGGTEIAASADDVNVIVTGGAGVKMTYLPLWAGGTRSVTVSVPD
jgi:hypothetical protein